MAVRLCGNLVEDKVTEQLQEVAVACFAPLHVHVAIRPLINAPKLNKEPKESAILALL